MAIYTVGRWRVILALGLTSALLLTLDLRGNPLIDRARDVFALVLDPVESATGVVTTPIEHTWHAVTNYDELEQENQALRDQVDRLIGTQAAAESSIIEYQELQALFNLPSLSGIDTEVAKVIGRSANNLDQVIEIDKGSTSGITVGMPVVNQAGLIGRVTVVYRTTALVMLITDSRYTVAVKLLAGSAPGPESTVTTTPSGLSADEVTDAATTTTTTQPPVNPDTTLPGAGPVAPGETTTSTTVAGADATTTTTVPPEDTLTADATSTTTTSTTTTTLPAVPAEKEFGALEGRGRGFLPQVRFLQDNPTLAVLEVGDLVETAGGLESLAPPGIPVGRVANRADRSGSGGPLLDVEPNADLSQLGFVRVVLYKPLSEVEQ